MAHSTLSPSGFKRWSGCPGSVRLTKDLPRTSSEYAARGTMCHAVAETCLRAGDDAFKFINTAHSVDGFDFVFGEDDAAITQAYIDNIRERINA